LSDRSTPYEEALLAQRIRTGDREALGELYDQYASVALAVALRIVADRGQAEDLVHDSFVTVWEKIDRYDTARGSLRSWVLTIVRNRSIDRVRAARPGIEIGEADEQSLLQTDANPTWDAAVANLGSTQLRAAMATLPDEQREAIELAYFGGHTYREIAGIVGIAEGTANGRLRLGLAKLKSSLRLTDAAPGSGGGEP
jgi:RNA polymerase sigma-70 factor (ECF subfamily)